MFESRLALMGRNKGRLLPSPGELYNEWSADFCGGPALKAFRAPIALSLWGSILLDKRMGGPLATTARSGALRCACDEGRCGGPALRGVRALAACMLTSGLALVTALGVTTLQAAGGFTAGGAPLGSEAQALSTISEFSVHAGSMW
eukprot:CAMPEP_0119341708 /NCGR_PEP_ID=MMETSP1333-20130426/103047_1 /TAXON_ID=418940 /ORGANISM="Scyphosphaera apsteinii, Strain RCC1455" /LENGTH=145 /DNA_ID=CAMNT_0007353755 /DNA_START=112 /DNA_END=549 /DNA_ORIENTATION=-